MNQRKAPIEALPPLDRFLDRHIEQTYDQSHFLGTRVLWAAILQAAGEDPTSNAAWAVSRLRIMHYIRRRYGLPPIVTRYIRLDEPSAHLTGGAMHGWLGLRLLLEDDVRPPQVRVRGSLS